MEEHCMEMISVQVPIMCASHLAFGCGGRLMTPVFVWEEGCCQAIRSDEVHWFRAKRREERFEACMARLRQLT